MSLVKTAELSGKQLEWAVLTAEGFSNLRVNPHPFDKTLIIDNPKGKPEFFGKFGYTWDWADGGHIIEREMLQINAVHHNDSCAVEPMAPKYGFKEPIGWHWEAYVLSEHNIDDNHHCVGDTPLIAAMRCYVSSKFGEEMEIPDELS